MSKLHPDPPYEPFIPHPDNRLMALTSNCSGMPTLQSVGTIISAAGRHSAASP